MHGVCVEKINLNETRSIKQKTFKNPLELWKNSEFLIKYDKKL